MEKLEAQIVGVQDRALKLCPERQYSSTLIAFSYCEFPLLILYFSSGFKHVLNMEEPVPAD